MEGRSLPNLPNRLGRELEFRENTHCTDCLLDVGSNVYIKVSAAVKTL
jgi:hypothetical protein